MTLKALLIDIDGTLMFKGEPIAGAARALHEAREAGLALRLLTNISARLPGDIAGELRAAGFDVADHEVQTAGTACARHVRGTSGATCHLLAPEAMHTLFDGVPLNDRDPDFVVIGDVAERFDYATLNHAFHLLRHGAQLVVPHKNLFWFDADGPRLDAGAFIVGLEAASGRAALVTGKPSPVFFDAALRELDVTADEALVVGDDLLTDIVGARAMGLRHVWVRTGKGALATTDADLPEHQVPSIASLMGLLRDAWPMR